MMTDERLAEAEEMADRLAGNHLPNQATIIRELVVEVRRLKTARTTAQEELDWIKYPGQDGS